MNNDHSSLGNPFDHRQSLVHGRDCGCKTCADAHSPASSSPSTPPSASRRADEAPAATGAPRDSEEMMDRVVESALVRGIFGHSDMHRRQFMKLVGGGTVAAALATLFPMDAIKAAVKEDLGPLEKTRLDVGFIPITCATPIIMAHPMGFYERYGLDVNVIKTAGWALIRDNSLNDNYDAAHMLSPMPLAMSLGAGSSRRAFITPAIENINGQAIVLHNDHQDKRDPAQWKACPSNTRCTTSCCATTSPNTASTPTRTSRSASFRHPRWSPTCAPATSTVSSRRTPSTSGRCSSASVSSTS
jgi:nitrate/nitrite transport system substrate-binding protein